MSMSIYIPYFYIIQHISSGKYYAGVKHGIDSNPNNLLKSNGYKTSSNIIKQIILEEGIEAFIIRKIKIFETAEQALDYELRFLKRVNAAFNDNFLNRSNNSIRALNVDYEKSKQTCLEKYGVENASKSEEVKEKIKQVMLEKYGCECPMHSEEIKEKRRQTCIALKNRPIVSEIRKYVDRFKLRLGSGWFWKKQEVLDIILAEIKITYQEI